MTIQECYQAMGGDYAQAASRLPSVKLIERFIAKFLDDTSYRELCDAMANGETEAAFRAAHTLKGVSGNLSFAALYKATSELTELLRPKTDKLPEGSDALFDEVRKQYALTERAIREYLDQGE